jgi:hypothetical protein
MTKAAVGSKGLSSSTSSFCFTEYQSLGGATGEALSAGIRSSSSSIMRSGSTDSRTIWLRAYHQDQDLLMGQQQRQLQPGLLAMASAMAGDTHYMMQLHQQMQMGAKQVLS